jgi:hypothetical protein
MRGRVIRQQEADFLQLDQLADGAVADAEVRQQLQRLRDDLFRVSPVLQVRDAANVREGSRHCFGYEFFH